MTVADTNVPLPISASPPLSVARPSAFASWNLQATRMLVGGDVVHALVALLLGTLVALACFSVGGDLAHAAAALPTLRKSARRRNSPLDAQPPPDDPAPPPPPHPPHPPHPRWSDGVATAASAALLAALLGAAVTAYATDTPDAWRSKLYLSLALAPAGALGRWQLSRLNAPHARVPLGTLAANTLAAALDAALAAALARAPPSARTAAALGAGVAGVGGTLSTVSAWAGEVAGLRAAAGGVGWAYVYVVASVAAAQAVGVAVYGAAVWSA
jgi:fluoride exporter